MKKNEKFLEDQNRICKKVGVACTETPSGSFVGLSENVGMGTLPINGLRHPLSNNTSGWYIWAGEYSEEADFFKPVHVEHLQERFPAAMKYLGLPPGYRFQIDDKGYEDIWEDKGLLDV